jgi:hypothetical protein
VFTHRLNEEDYSDVLVGSKCELRLVSNLSDKLPQSESPKDHSCWVRTHGDSTFDFYDDTRGSDNDAGGAGVNIFVDKEIWYLLPILTYMRKKPRLRAGAKTSV